MPSSLVVAVCARIRFGLVTVTSTPGTAAPLTSTTVPSIEPVVEDWADALIAKNESESIRASIPVKIRMGFLILSIPFIVFSQFRGTFSVWRFLDCRIATDPDATQRPTPARARPGGL